MACLGLPDILRIARSGVGEVPGAAEHLATCATCAAALGARVRENRSGDADVEQLGRYQILSERGRGAFGRVFEAFDPALDRRVAIKLISFSTPSSPAALAELLREAKAMAQIQHPNVIPIFDVGRTRDGVFLTMPIIDGENLGDWAARQRATGVDPDRVIASFAGKVAAGLAAIHAAGFVHRDIKPSNVLVAGTNAWIADLGLARRTTRSTVMNDAAFADGELTASTHTESLGGTPAYMAPECLIGGAASPASDQYALAVSLVEILTGHRPFAAKTYLELLTAYRTSAPRLDDVPPRYRAQLTRALAPAPEERFASVAAFAAALVVVPRKPRRALAALALIPVLGVIGWELIGTTRVQPPPVVDARQQLVLAPDARVPDAQLSVTIAPSTHAPCADRCTIDHRRALDRCNQSEASCRATSTSAFAGCDAAVDAARCDQLRTTFVQACTHHAVTLDQTCIEHARACVASCTASEKTCEATSAPPSAESCRAAMAKCQAAAAAEIDPLESTRRRGWADCTAANATCRTGPPGAPCAEELQRCNKAVAAQYERGKDAVDREDHGCLVTQNECFAGTSTGETCRKAAGSCAASCARPQYECLAKPLASDECATAASDALAACQRTCR